MPTLSINADPRPLPTGWTAHFDHQRNMLYYVNLNTMPPQLHLVHPDDQGRSSNIPPLRQRRDTVPAGPLAHRQHETRRLMPNLHSTPFAAAIEAQNSKEPTFAQKLYASSLPAPLATQKEENGVIEEGIESLYGFSGSDVPWRTPSPQEILDTIPTQTMYSPPPSSPMSVPSMTFSASSISASPTSSPPPFSSPMPEWNPPSVTPAPSRRPRGARTPSFPRPLIPTFSLPAEEDNPRDSDPIVIFPDRSSPQIHHVFQPAPQVRSGIPLISSISPPPPPPFATPPPVPATVPANCTVFPSTLPKRRTRHNRSATFPNITSVNPMVGYSQSSVQMSKPKETPMYTLVARPPEGPTNTTNISSSPPCNNLLPITPIPIRVSQTKPSLSPLIIPNSAGTQLPMGVAVPLPNLNIPPTQPLVNDDQRQTLVQGGIGNFHQEETPNPPNATHGNHEVLKQVGIAVGKSVGKSALRIGTKVLLGSMGIPTNPFSSNNDSGDVISSGLANMVASAATAAATAAMKPSHQPPTTVPPSTNSAADYAAVLAQMQKMQLQQPVQQIMPQQTGFDPSNAQMAALMAQMQMLQLQQQQFRPPVQIPPSNTATTSQNTVQNIPQQQLPQWQQSLVSNVIGGATNALVSGAMSNFNIPGTMDSDNGASSFTDFASFDANA